MLGSSTSCVGASTRLLSAPMCFNWPQRGRSLVRTGLMCCLDDNSHFIPLRVWVDLPRETGCEEEEEGASEAMLWLQGE